MDLVKRILEVQQTKTTRFDWSCMVEKDRMDYEIDIVDEEIVSMSKKTFKKYVNSKVNKKAFEELVESKKSKVKEIIANNSYSTKKDNEVKM